MNKIRTLLALTAVALGGLALGATGARTERPLSPVEAGDRAPALSIAADNAVVIERATTTTGEVWQVALEDVSL